MGRRVSGRRKLREMEEGRREGRMKGRKEGAMAGWGGARG
jgi:hypothetical protein